jgi:hypothetical protein
MCVAPRQELCPGNTIAKLQNVWETSKKVQEKFEGNGKKAVHFSAKTPHNVRYLASFFGGSEFI